MRIPSRAVLAVAGIAVAMSGCGGSSKSSSSSASGESSKPATQILSDSQAALRQVHSLQVQGTVTISNRPASVSLGIQTPGKLNVGITQGATTAAIILLGNDAYIKANAPFYRQQANVPSAGVALIADRWLKTTASGVASIGSLAKDADPATLARCLAFNHGTLSVTGKSTVNGQSAIVLVDKGDRPGSTPSQLSVAAAGPPLPLRVVATGRQQPGGAKDAACSNGADLTNAGDTLTFSGYNRPLSIVAPAGAIPIPG